MSGVADVVFANRTMYALISGAGCSHGLIGTTNQVIQVDLASGTWIPVADLSAFLADHPVAHPNPDDFEPDGTWWNLIEARGKLYATEPNHGEIDVVIGNGVIHRLVDISATHGHIVPTALAFKDRLFLSTWKLRMYSILRLTGTFGLQCRY